MPPLPEKVKRFTQPLVSAFQANREQQIEAIETSPLLNKAAEATEALSGAIRDKFIAPLATMGAKLGKEAVSTVLEPGTKYVTPRLKEAGVSTGLATGIGLGLDIIAPGPGEFGVAANKIKKFTDPLVKKALPSSDPLSYKTAEEYVKAQTKLLHGTDKKFDLFDPAKMGTNEKNFAAKNSFFFTDSAETAKSYGKNLKEVYAKFENPVTIDAEGKMFGDMRDIIDETVTNAKKNGNDGVIIKNLSDRKDWGNYEPATHYAIFDTTKLKTKSQLTDIWEKANKNTGGYAKIGTLATGAGLSAYAVSQVPQIDGKETPWVNNLAEEVKNDFPFEQLAKTELQDLKYREFDFKEEGRGGEQRPSGNELYVSARKVLNEQAAEWLTKKFKKLDKPNVIVEKNLERPVKNIMAHEMLHHLFNKSAIGFGYEQNRENVEKLGMKFLEEWDNLYEKYPILARIDEHLEASGYDLSDNYGVATERFAYLGENAAKMGINAIPPELRKYYKGIIRDTRPTVQDPRNTPTMDNILD